MDVTNAANAGSAGAANVQDVFYIAIRLHGRNQYGETGARAEESVAIICMDIMARK